MPTQCTTSPLLSRQALFLQHSLYYGRVLCKIAAARAAALHTFISRAASKDGSCRRANTVHHFSLALTTSTFASALLTSWLFAMQNCSSARSRAAHFHIVSRVQGQQLPTCQHSAPLLLCSHDKFFCVSAPDIMVLCYAKLQQRAQPRCTLSLLEPHPRTAAADVPTQCTTSPLLSRQALFLQHSLYYGRVLCKTAAARAAALHTFISRAASKDGSCRVPTQCTTSRLLSRLALLRQHSLYYGRVLCKTAVARAAALHTFIS